MMVNMKKFYLIALILLSACVTNYKGDELPDLKGKKASQVLSILGKPVSERQEGTSKMWAYYQQSCSTLIFFNQQDIVQYAEQRGDCGADNFKQGEK